jgi:hypothetical protein
MVATAPQEWVGYRYCGGLTANIEVSTVDRYLEHWVGGLCTAACVVAAVARLHLEWGA